MPTLNFVDAASMASWIEARVLVLETGQRFTMRAQFYLSVFLSVTFGGWLYCFATASGYINPKYLKVPQWIALVTFLTVYMSLCLNVMWPYSYVNE